MKKQADRQAIVISAALTLLVLLGLGGVLLLQGNPLAAAASDGSASLAAGAEVSQSAAPLAAGSNAASTEDPVVAAYQTRLQEASQALTEAYAQIDALQAAQAPASAQSYDEHDDDDAWEHDARAQSFNQEHDDHEHDEHDDHEHDEHDDD